MYERGRSISNKAATLSARSSRAFYCTIATIPDGDNPCPVCPSFRRSLSVVQGELSILYSCANFEGGPSSSMIQF